MTDFFHSKSSDPMEVVVSRMAALDGCSFRFFTESQDLKQLFKKSGCELPASSKTIAKIVFTQAEKVKSEMKHKIIELKLAGHRFALSLDEWTSLRNKRYMNINLHSRGFGGFNFKNLGLVKITGTMPALTALNMLRDHLAKFEVTLDEDVVSHTTDGASVMVKMGTFCKNHHQLCLAHGVQLAVLDTLYKNAKEPQPAPIFMQHALTNDSESETDDEEGLEAEQSRFEIENVRVQSHPSLYKEVIKVRRLVKTIRKSPLKADSLREYVIKEHGKDIQLQLDCRTRWSSMSDMIGVFLRIKDSIFKSLIDWKSNIAFSEAEVQTLTNIHQSLNVVKLAVLSLCRRDSILYTVDTALRFMLKKLDEQNSFLSTKLATNLRNRIKQRRLLLAGVLHYLHDSDDFFKQTDDDTFRKPNSEEIEETIITLLQLLKYKDNAVSSEINDEGDAEVCDIGVDEAEVNESTLQEQLDKELSKCKEPRTNQKRHFDLAGFVKVEKAMYDNGGERGIYLTQAYNYILGVLPTSVESERVFSYAGYFCNRLQSSLSDKMLDALILLRTHYQQERSFLKK